jgi:hypothetical protein
MSLSSVPTLPLQRVARVIEGEGALSGQQVILILFGLPNSVKYLHLDNPARMLAHKHDVYNVPVSDVVQFCERFPNLPVHLGGEDPAFCESLKGLLNAFADNRSVVIDTFGVVPLPLTSSTTFVSISPRPGLPLLIARLLMANELRLYVSTREQAWNDVTESVLALVRIEEEKDEMITEATLRIIPRDLHDPADVELALRTVFDNPRLTATFPLYRMLPAIDGISEELELEGYDLVCKAL